MFLFRVAGITVSLHWTWLVVAYIELSGRAGDYPSLAWNIAEYLALFGIVLIHEFGHALACRQVGGQADSIVLWPLGGVAYVNPPPRPGAVLWSIAAGPLVNVVLVPVTVGLWIFSGMAGWHEDYPDLANFITALAFMNGLLLAFNILPIYPLDGGKILYALLWFVIGRARSLQVVSITGFLGAAALIGVSVKFGNRWLIIMALFIAFQAWAGFQQAGILRRRLEMPRHVGFICPTCGMAPPCGSFWRCGQCGVAFDTFDFQSQCPNCHERFAETGCPECGRSHPMEQWYPSVQPAPAGKQTM
jgi:Zn-dependent protease